MHQAWARALKASSDYDDGDDSHSDDSDMSDWDVSDDWDGMDSDDGDSEDRFDSSGKQPMPRASERHHDRTHVVSGQVVFNRDGTPFSERMARDGMRIRALL